MIRRGFTLVELLVTMSILGIIAAFSVPAYQTMQKSVALNNGVQEVADAIRVAQTRALSAQDGVNQGIRFATSSVTLFDENGDIRTQALPSSLTLSSTQSEVVFERLSGQADQAVTVTISNGSSKTIAISPSGKISLN